jgi:hypothetical protein
MKKIILSCVLISICFGFAACTSTPEAQDLYFEKGKYSFTVYDRTGDSIASGIFDIKGITGNDIFGTYIFNKMYQPSQLITANETKEMTGSLTDDRKNLFINANPKMADNNIFLNITVGLYSFRGDWRYSTYVGTVDQGKIIAYKYTE